MNLVEACKQVGGIWMGKAASCSSYEQAKRLAAMYEFELPAVSDRPIKFSQFGKLILAHTQRRKGECIEGWGVDGCTLALSFPMPTPVVVTSRLDEFIQERCFAVPGEKVPFAEFYERFIEYLAIADRHNWTRQRVSRSLPIEHPSGAGTANAKFIANLSWEQKDVRPDAKSLILKDGKLIYDE